MAKVRFPYDTSISCGMGFVDCSLTALFGFFFACLSISFEYWSIHLVYKML